MKRLVRTKVVFLLGALFIVTGFLAFAQSESGTSRNEEKHTVEEPVTSRTVEDAHEQDNVHDHDQDHEKKTTDQQHEEEHVEGAEHSHEEAESQNVGPEKGITAADESLGIMLSPEAIRSFSLQLHRLSGQGPWSIPSSAKLTSGDEVNLYRLRDGYFKRVDFSAPKTTGANLLVHSQSLAEGDEIVVFGVGFLRIVELAAFGGVAEGHSH